MIEEDEETPKLSRKHIDALERQANKLVGSKQERWQDTKTLCTTCQHAFIVRRSSTNRRFIKCTFESKVMPEDVEECNSYMSMTDMSLSTMASMATLIGGIPERKVGFRKE